MGVWRIESYPYSPFFETSIYGVTHTTYIGVTQTAHPDVTHTIL